jgi:hypothetical protein
MTLLLLERSNTGELQGKTLLEELVTDQARRRASEHGEPGGRRPTLFTPPPGISASSVAAHPIPLLSPVASTPRCQQYGREGGRERSSLK